MNEKEGIELQIFMGKNKLDTDHPFDEHFYSKIALTFKRGEKMETVPPASIR